MESSPSMDSSSAEFAETTKPARGLNISYKGWIIIGVVVVALLFFFFVPVLGSSSSAACVEGATTCDDNPHVSLTLFQALWLVLF